MKINPSTLARAIAHRLESAEAIYLHVAPEKAAVAEYLLDTTIDLYLKNRCWLEISADHTLLVITRRE